MRAITPDTESPIPTVAHRALAVPFRGHEHKRGSRGTGTTEAKT